MAKKLHIVQMLLFGTRRLNHKVEMQRLQCKNEIADLKAETLLLKNVFIGTFTSPIALGLFSVAGFLTGYFSKHPMPRLKKTFRFVSSRIPWPLLLTFFSSLLTKSDEKPQPLPEESIVD